jgi:hypothetical protein
MEGSLGRAMSCCAVDNPTVTEHLRAVMRDVIEEISEAEGEGCLIVFVSDEAIARKYIRAMDRPERSMVWRRDAPRLIGLDRTLLRSMAILDGMTLVAGDRIIPRMVAYPHMNDKAFCFADVVCSKGDHPIKVRLVEKGMFTPVNTCKALDGKGSKHNGAAGLSLVLWWEREYNQDENRLRFEIVTVSADGPVKSWPEALGIRME